MTPDWQKALRQFDMMKADSMSRSSSQCHNGGSILQGKPSSCTYADELITNEGADSNGPGGMSGASHNCTFRSWTAQLLTSALSPSLLAPSLHVSIVVTIFSAAATRFGCIALDVRLTASAVLDRFIT